MMLATFQSACSSSIGTWISEIMFHPPIKTSILLCTEAPETGDMPGSPLAKPCYAMFCLPGHNYFHHLHSMQKHTLGFCSCPWWEMRQEKIMCGLQCHAEELELDPWDQMSIALLVYHFPDSKEFVHVPLIYIYINIFIIYILLY